MNKTLYNYNVIQSYKVIHDYSDIHFLKDGTENVKDCLYRYLSLIM